MERSAGPMVEETVERERVVPRYPEYFVLVSAAGQWIVGREMARFIERELRPVAAPPVDLVRGCPRGACTSPHRPHSRASAVVLGDPRGMAPVQGRAAEGVSGRAVGLGHRVVNAWPG